LPLARRSPASAWRVARQQGAARNANSDGGANNARSGGAGGGGCGAEQAANAAKALTITAEHGIP
jgi:hypothetical protein